MLTVACTYYVGKDVPKWSKGVFDPTWVDKLYRGVRRNLTGDLRFVCVTDQTGFEEPIDIVPFERFHNNMWCILECLRVTGDPVLFMGLDTIITGNLDEIAQHKPAFAMVNDPYHDRMCSGAMMWLDRTDLWKKFNEDPKRHSYRMAGCPSDMGWLEEHGKPSALDIAFPHEIISYKAHYKKSWELGQAKIVYFHGREKPHEIMDPTLLEHWV